MKLADFVLLQFLWQFEALRQANKKTISKSIELGSDRTLPTTGDSQSMKDFRTIHHDGELKQEYENKPHTKPEKFLLFWLLKVRKNVG